MLIDHTDIHIDLPDNKQRSKGRKNKLEGRTLAMPDLDHENVTKYHQMSHGLIGYL